MSSTITPKLALPLIAASQSQKHITHNEALFRLDACTQLNVLDMTRTTPPTSPSEGDMHLIAAAPTGAWSGKAGQVAHFSGGLWLYYVPQEGWLLWVRAEDRLLVFNGASWQDVSAALAGFDNLKRLGINTTADATNRLSVRSNAALFTAIPAAESGSGDVRATLSKEAAARTASFVFQNNFSGRAEFGLCGNDSFSLRLSSNGSTWATALSADPANNRVTFAGDVCMPSLNGGAVAGFRNLLINGGFDIWQRSTTFTASNVYTADRWRTLCDDAAGRQVSRQSFTVGQTDVPNARFFLRHRHTATATSKYVEQPIEEVGLLAGRTITVSFFARSSVAKSHSVKCDQNFGIGGSAVVVGASTALSITTSWARYAVTLTLPSISGKTVGSGSYTSLMIFDNTPATPADFEIACVQLEVGTLSTPFELRPLALEISLCQRYYEIGGSGDTGGFISATNAQLGAHFAVPKRTTPFVNLLSTSPTLTEIGTAIRTATGSSISAAISATGMFYELSGFSGATAFRPAVARDTNIWIAEIEL